MILIDNGNTWSFNNKLIESVNVYVSPFFLNFYYDNLTNAYINWNLTRPLYGTSWFPFQSAPDIELVVINVKSVIFNGVSLLIIFDCWQNYVHELLDTAHMSLNGLHDEKYLYANFIAL